MKLVNDYQKSWEYINYMHPDYKEDPLIATVEEDRKTLEVDSAKLKHLVDACILVPFFKNYV
jgi:hypothetical protein